MSDRPEYYDGDHGLRCEEVINNFFAHKAWLAMAFKYLARAGKKVSEVEDLKKAKSVIDLELGRLSGETWRN